MAEETHPADRFTRRLRGALRRDARRLLTPGPADRPAAHARPGGARRRARAAGARPVHAGRRGPAVQRGERGRDHRDDAAAGQRRPGCPRSTSTSRSPRSRCAATGATRPTPVTSMRLVRYRALDLSRLAEADRIVCDGWRRAGWTCAAASCRAVRGDQGAAPVPALGRRRSGWAGLAASIALLLGGGAITAAAAFAVTAVIDRIGRCSTGCGLPAFFQQALGGLLATAVDARRCSRSGSSRPGTRPSSSSPRASPCCCPG